MDKRIGVCRMIASDMENDAIQLDGKPFNGKTVAEQFGNNCAAIAALAGIVAELIEERSHADLSER